MTVDMEKIELVHMTRLVVVVAPMEVVVAPLEVVVAPLEVVVAPLEVVVALLVIEHMNAEVHTKAVRMTVAVKTFGN